MLTLNGSQETLASLLVGIFSGIESNQKMTQMFEKTMFMLVFTYIWKYNMASYSLFRHTSVSITLPQQHQQIEKEIWGKQVWCTAQFMCIAITNFLEMNRSK